MAATIKIEVTTTGGLDQVKKDVDDLGARARESGSGFSSLGEIATGALRRIGEMAVNLAATGLSAIGGVLSDSISAARESNQVAAQTAQVIKSTGQAAGVTAQHVLDYASALSAASGKSLFGDEQIAQSTNLLLTFTNIKGATLDAATAISVDMAQALGGAPKDAAIQLGKALNDPLKGITALTRVGVTFSDEQKAQIQAMQEAGDTAGAQAVILAELNKEFGGSAAAAAAADGGVAQFKDRLGEAEETIGKAILPILNQLTGILLTNVMPVIENVTATFGQFVDIAMKGNMDLGTVFDLLSNILPPDLAANITDVVGVVWNLVDAFGTGAEGGGLVGGITNALYSLDTISPVFDTIGDVINAVATVFTQEAQTLIDVFGEGGFGSVINVLLYQLAGLNTNVKPLIEAALSPLIETITRVRDAFQDAGLQSAINVLLYQLDKFSPTFALIHAAIDAALPAIQSIVLSVFSIISGFIAEHGEKIKSDIIGVWQQIQATVQALIPPIQITITTVFGVIQDFLHAHGADIQAFLGQTWDQIAGIVRTVLPLIQGIITGVLAIIVGFIREHGAQIQQVFTDTWNIIKNVITGALDIIQGLLSAALAIFRGDWEGAWNAIQQMSVTVTQKIWEVIKSALDMIAAFFGTSLQGIVDLWTNNFNMLVTIVDKVAGDLVASGEAIVENLKEGISNAWGKLVDWFDAKLQELRNKLPFSEPKDSSSPLYGLGKSGAALIFNILDGVQGAIPSLGSVLDDALTNLVENFHMKAEDLNRTFDALTKASQQFAASVSAAIADAFSGTASFDRLKAKAIAGLKDVSDAQLANVQSMLNGAEQVADAMTDPQQAAKFFKMRSDQIFDLAKLQDQISSATDEETRRRLQAQMDLIVQAQNAEQLAFQNQASTTSPIAKLTDSLRAFLQSDALSYDNPMVRQLNDLLNQLTSATAPVAAQGPGGTPGSSVISSVTFNFAPITNTTGGASTPMDLATARSLAGI